MSMNIGEIVSTLEELVVRVAVLEKAVATLKSQVQQLSSTSTVNEQTGA